MKAKIMPMANKGLAKLIEELGELSQVAGKKLACPNTDEHWDGKGSLKIRMQDEVADVIAALCFVIKTNDLSESHITLRAEEKLRIFEQWNSESNK
jgi:NTP pyrophosphatase (non-canonical NTP hydrolase)